AESMDSKVPQGVLDGLSDEELLSRLNGTALNDTSRHLAISTWKSALHIEVATGTSIGVKPCPKGDNVNRIAQPLSGRLVAIPLLILQLKPRRLVTRQRHPT